MVKSSRVLSFEEFTSTLVGDVTVPFLPVGPMISVVNVAPVEP